MKPPSGETQFFGHPLIALPIIGVCAAFLYVCYCDSAAWPLGLMGLMGMLGVVNAHDRVSKYRAWKRAWDGMAPSAGSPSTLPARKLIGGGIVAVAVLYAAAHLDDPMYQLTLGWLVIGGAITGLVLLVRGKRGAKAPGSSTDVVSLAVARAVLPVPSMKDAYLALPKHCWDVLR